MKISTFEIPEEIVLNNKKLKLNGAAMRTKFFVNTYILAFYSETPINTSEDAIHSTIARSLRMIIATPMATPTVVSESIEKGLKESLGSDYKNIKHIVEEIKSNIINSKVGYKDSIDNFYDSDKTLYFYKNDNAFGKNDKDGYLLAEALFDIYMGKKPKDEKIKKALLNS